MWLWVGCAWAGVPYIWANNAMVMVTERRKQLAVATQPTETPPKSDPAERPTQP